MNEHEWFKTDTDGDDIKNMHALVSILTDDGWVLFNNPTGQSSLLPYGEGIRMYDSTLAVEHPMWNKIVSN